MFEEESQWNVDKSADKLNQSLFCEVPILTSSKKKTQKKIDQVLNAPVKSHLTAEKKRKARLRNKYPAAQTIATKENHGLCPSVENDITKRNDLVTSTALSKKEKAVKVVLPGDSVVSKKRKEKKSEATVVSEVSQPAKVATKKHVGAHKTAESAEVQLSCQEGHTPDKKRKKNRKRKPKNKYAHLVQKKDPAEGSLCNSEEQSQTGRKQVKPASAAPSQNIVPKISRKVKKSKIRDEWEHSEGKSVPVPSDVSTGLHESRTKMKHKNNKEVASQNVDGSSKEIGFESPKIAVVESRSAKKRNKKKELLDEMKKASDIGEGLVTVKSRQDMGVSESGVLTRPKSGSGDTVRGKKRRHQIDDEKMNMKSKKPKISSNVGDDSGVQESGGKNSRKRKTKSTAKTVDTKLDNTSPKIAKSVSTSSPFDVSELRKRLSIGGDSRGAKVMKGVGKDVGSEAQKAEVKRKQPQTLRERMMEKLNSARFRAINEQLYTCSGKEAYSLFEDDPSTFKVYHEGFQNQVEKWPVNPVDKMIEYIQSKSNSNLIVADFGCGDAKIAQSVSNKVHSFDLVAVNEHITACDMSKVPLRSNCVDIGIFCLSLMGTNLVDYLHEANRIMKIGGVLLIAEVVSRIDRVNIFIHRIEDLGFMLMHKDKSNKMFILFEFKKARHAPPKHRLEPIELLPCVYKKR